MTFGTACPPIRTLTLFCKILINHFRPLRTENPFFPIFKNLFWIIQYLFIAHRTLTVVTLFKAIRCLTIAALFNSSPFKKFLDFRFVGVFTQAPIRVFNIHYWICISVFIKISHYRKFFLHKICLFLHISCDILYPAKTSEH